MLLDQFGHHEKGRAGICDKPFQPGAQIVMARFAIALEGETILGAAPALSRQSIELVLSKLMQLALRRVRIQPQSPSRLLQLPLP